MWIDDILWTPAKCEASLRSVTQRGMTCLRGFRLLTPTLFDYLHVQTRSFPLFMPRVQKLLPNLRTIEQKLSLDKFLTRYEQGCAQGTVFNKVAAPHSAVCHFLTTAIVLYDFQQEDRTRHSDCTVLASLDCVVTGQMLCETWKQPEERKKPPVCSAYAVRCARFSMDMCWFVCGVSALSTVMSAVMQWKSGTLTRVVLLPLPEK